MQTWSWCRSCGSQPAGKCLPEDTKTFPFGKHKANDFDCHQWTLQECSGQTAVEKQDLPCMQSAHDELVIEVNLIALAICPCVLSTLIARCHCFKQSSSAQAKVSNDTHTWRMQVPEVHAWGQMGFALPLIAALRPVCLQSKRHWHCTVSPDGRIINVRCTTLVVGTFCLCVGSSCLVWAPC